MTTSVILFLVLSLSTVMKYIVLSSQIRIRGRIKNWDPSLPSTSVGRPVSEEPHHR